MLKNKIFTIVAVFAVFALLNTGCATTTSLTADQIAHIRTIKFDKQIAMPKDMIYLAPGASLLFGFGIVGGAIAGISMHSEGKIQQKMSEQNNISVPAIVSYALEDEFRKNSRFRLVTAGPADAILKVKVNGYGFAVPNGFSSVLKPIVNLSAELVDNSGRVIWRDYTMQYVTFSDLPTYTTAQLRNQRQTVVDAFRIAAHDAAAKLVNSMQSKNE
jgi:hypothetical protein